jgi:dehydrogenase/reductase SDR family member 4
VNDSIHPTNLVSRVCCHHCGIQVHALICNAAASIAFGPLLSTTEEQFSKMLHTNLLSTFLTVREFSSRSSLARGSSVVFVTSLGAYTPLPSLGAYSVTKTALLGLTKALAVEMGADGVRVNAVAPGIIKTKFSERLWRSLDKDASGGAKQMPVQVPLGRLGVPGDISGVVSFLVGDDAKYITGETVVAAGGMPSRL